METINQVQLSRAILQQSQDRDFPFVIPYAGLSIEVHRNVFSPVDFHGWRLFTPLLLAHPGEHWLEVGSGTGIMSCYLAREGATVTAVDLNPKAVANTRVNAHRNSVTVDSRCSDIFSALRSDERFDAIYWNMPFIRMPVTYKHQDALELGLFDPGYAFAERFFREASSHLRPEGVLYAGLADFADTHAIRKLASNYGYRSSVLATMASEEGTAVEFELWKFTPKTAEQQ